jgi:uncharacterized protein
VPALLLLAIFAYAKSPALNPHIGSDRPIFARDSLLVKTATDAEHEFDVEIATSQIQVSYGLMFTEELAEDVGMLFIFPQSGMLTFWMKNTFIPLDMIFISADGRIINIAANAKPFSTDMQRAAAPAKAVLEINGGLAEKLGIQPGDRVIHPSLSLSNTE